jgi:acyl carrier protein
MNHNIESVTRNIYEILEFDYRGNQTINDFSSLESWDSLAQLQIVLLVEGALGRTLTDLEIESLSSLDSVIQLLGLTH